MTKKRFILTFLLIFTLLNCFSAVVAKDRYYTQQEIQGVPDPLERYTVKEEVHGFFAKINKALSPINQKLKDWWIFYIKPKLEEYKDNIKARVKQGIEEEKNELLENKLLQKLIK